VAAARVSQFVDNETYPHVARWKRHVDFLRLNRP
jgi:hypothetical protein